MSARPLQALLVEAEQAGAFYLTAADLQPLQSAASGLGFRCACIDLAGCTGQTGLMRRFADALGFPAHTGNDWDALDDCLRDLQWLPGDGYVLGLDHPQALRASAPDDFATLVSILEGASLHWRDRGIPFWAFIAVPDDEFDALR